MKLEKQLQDRIVQHVTKTKNSYKSFNSARKQQLVEIYNAVASFEGEKRAEWASALKVNFAHQIENLIVARLTARSPKFVVSLRSSVQSIVDRYYPIKDLDEDATEEEQMRYAQKLEERARFEQEVSQWAGAVQDYLNFAFKEYGFKRKFRLAAKALVRYGNVYGGVNYRTDYFSKKRKGKVEKKLWREYPDVDIISFSEMYLDPRYLQTADSPAVIRSHENVRLAELHQTEGLINLDKIKCLNSETANTYKQEMYSIRIQTNIGEDTKQFKNLVVDKYQGYFRKDENDPSSECLYEFWVVNNLVLVKMEEIPRITIHSASCFEDVEQHYSVGYVEPMLGLEREYNFKMNSAIEYINQQLNRSWYWDPNSGVNPKSLASLGPGSVIIAQKGMEAAQNGVRELQYNQIPQAYFANNNEVRRDIQTVTHTVDTTAPSQAQGFTNTATAVRARFFESNTVYADTLKHLEEFWVEIAYDIADSIAENAKSDVIIKNLGKNKFKWAKPEIFDDAPIRYAIDIEVGSSSFDSVEGRREESLAQWTLAKDAAAAGIQVDLEKVYKNILETFDNKNPEEFITRDFAAVAETAARQLTGAETEQIAPDPTGLENVEQMTSDVVQGNLTANI